MAFDTKKSDLFARPGSRQPSKREANDATARGIIKADDERRRANMARLREARLAQEAEQAAQAAAAAAAAPPPAKRSRAKAKVTEAKVIEAKVIAADPIEN